MKLRFRDGLQIVTNTRKDRKQKNFYGDIEALAVARRALKNLKKRIFSGVTVEEFFAYIFGIYINTLYFSIYSWL